MFTVKQLLAVRLRGSGHQNLVDWEGYSPEEGSLTPSSNIVEATLIQDFRRRHPDQPGTSGADPAVSCFLSCIFLFLSFLDPPSLTVGLLPDLFHNKLVVVCVYL